MAQFYAEIKGNRGKASRMGTKASGIKTHIRGWDIGVQVECYHIGSRGAYGEDIIAIFPTGGSHSPGCIDKPIAHIKSDGHGGYVLCNSLGGTP